MLAAKLVGNASGRKSRRWSFPSCHRSYIRRRCERSIRRKPEKSPRWLSENLVSSDKEGEQIGRSQRKRTVVKPRKLSPHENRSVGDLGSAETICILQLASTYPSGIGFSVVLVSHPGSLETK
jgi:hypothetical protein